MFLETQLDCQCFGRMMLLCLSHLLMIIQFFVGNISNNTPICDVDCRPLPNGYTFGTITVGGILPQYNYNMLYSNNFMKMREPWRCFELSSKSFLHHMAFIYAVDEINKNPEILPNLTLESRILSSCSSTLKALQSTLTILSEQTQPVPNYSCQKQRSVVGIIGAKSSATSYAIAQMLGLYKYPQISYGALDPLFSDKLRFPSFYRTVPNERSFFAGITQLLRYFGWTWVGIVVADDDSGERGLQGLKKAVAQSGGCIDFVLMLPVTINLTAVTQLKMLYDAIKLSTSHVIILYISGSAISHHLIYLNLFPVPQKTWIVSPGMDIHHTEDTMDALNGSLGFSIKIGEINGYSDFLYDLNPSRFKHDATVAYNWQNLFRCKLIDNRYNKELSYAKLPFCSGNESMRRLGFSFLQLSNARLAYSVYTAVYALAHAVHDMLFSENQKGITSAPWNAKQDLEHWKVNKFLKKIHFKTANRDDIFFDDSGDVTAIYDIVNWHHYPEKGTVVGGFNPSAPPGHQLVINQSSVKWHIEGHSINQIPRSTCTGSCLPGYRKAPIEGRSICCYDCVPCAEGEFANSTDMDTCLRCPDSHWPNEMKDGCIPRTIDFLSYSDYLGVCLASLAVLFFISTAGVLGIFVRYRHTPIVRANNRNLSYMLLVSLMLSFLCSLLFIGQPGTLTCQIQQAAFGIIFTVAVSCVLTKTIVVVIAFNATKPGSRLSRWLGSGASGSMVTLCTLGEVVICLSWQLTSPPHPDTDTVSETRKMILQCNQGSVTAFYAVIGYMGGLAFASFIVAFLARSLPDRFNEAQLITFSMLVFCSVWVSFIPAYLSTKGRYMVAVEVFAILASSAGLLGCIFIPKCYIILFRPEINTRQHIVVKSFV